MLSKTFLLVDDDSDDAELFSEAVEEIDSSVACYCASDGREALNKLNNKVIIDPDIIFLDINMPEMNGWQFLSKLKGDTAYRDIPVIMYSTSSLKQDILTAKNSGALCFFTKPDEYLRLKKILEIVIAHMKKDALQSVCDAVHNLKWKS